MKIFIKDKTNYFYNRRILLSSELLYKYLPDNTSDWRSDPLIILSYIFYYYLLEIY